MTKVRTVIDREGVVGTARLGFGRLRRRTYLDETHGWYELPLDAELEGDGLPAGLRLVRAGDADVGQALETPGSDEEMIELLHLGHDLWLVRDGHRSAFSCWTYRGRTPVLAARGGWLDLPPGTVCLEDSATNPDYRGRGVAPAAWREIARTLRGEGARTIVTKIAADNVPSQRAVMKVGFRQIGTMRLKRFVARRRVEFTDAAAGGAPTMAALVEMFMR